MTHSTLESKVVPLNLINRLIETRKKLQSGVLSSNDEVKTLSPKMLQMFQRRMNDIGSLFNKELETLDAALSQMKRMPSRTESNPAHYEEELDQAFDMLEESAWDEFATGRKPIQIQAEKELLAKLNSAVPLSVTKPRSDEEKITQDQVQQLLVLLHEHANKQSQKINCIKDAIWGKTIRKEDGSSITTTRSGTISKVLYPDGRSTRIFEYDSQTLIGYTDLDGSYWTLQSANCWIRHNKKSGKATGEKRCGHATVTTGGSFVWSCLGGDARVIFVVDSTDGTRTKHFKGGETMTEFFASAG